ncbi:hypothetical protein ACKKBG_A20995 [Auxenochlorella protothecoides x Auxenochlorella symbiontica]
MRGCSAAAPRAQSLAQRAPSGHRAPAPALPRPRSDVQTMWAHRRGRRACRLRAALVEPVIDFTHHREAWDDWPDDAEDEPSVGDEGFDEDVEPAEEAFGPQMLVAAGFLAEELAHLRLMLDQAAASDLPLIPATPQLLDSRVSSLSSVKEPDWEVPLPDSFVPGGGWGGTRVLLCSGLLGEAQVQLWTLLQNSGLGTIYLAVLSPGNAHERLGDVFAQAVQEQQGAEAAGASPPVNAGGGGWRWNSAAAPGAGSDGFDPGSDEEEDGDEDEGESDLEEESEDEDGEGAVFDVLDAEASGSDEEDDEGDSFGDDKEAGEPCAGPVVSRQQVLEASQSWGVDTEALLAEVEAKGFTLTP